MTISIIAIASLFFASAALAARPVGVRISWLQERHAFHHYICAHGQHEMKKFHCLADKWTSKELRQALAERYYHLAPTNDWGIAVSQVQRIYPGTASWLLSCSHGEGGHGRWVRYGGGGYYAGYEHTDAVGGWMQFRPSTFRPYYWKALAYVRSKGFKVRLNENDWLGGWQDPLAQALTAGYMRAVAGNSHWHWQASIDRGCA